MVYSIETAARNLTDMYAASGVCYDVGPGMTCAELDALAKLFVAVGNSDLAAEWVRSHAEESESEEEGDSHFGVTPEDYVREVLS